MKPTRYPVREDITVLPADHVCFIPDSVAKFFKDRNLLLPYRTRIPPRLGWIIYEEVGIVIINDYAINKIYVDEPRTRTKTSLIWQRLGYSLIRWIFLFYRSKCLLGVAFYELLC